MIVDTEYYGWTLATLWHRVFSNNLENPKMAMMGVIYTEAMLEIVPRIAKPQQRVFEQQK